MTTPLYQYSVGRAIQQAYVKACLIPAGQQPSSGQIADAIGILTDIVNFQQTKGLKLFSNIDTTITLSAGTYMYGLGPAGSIPMTKPLRAVLAYFVSAAGSITPMTPVSWQEWVILQKSNQAGTPVNFFVDKQAAVLNVGVWPPPDSTAATGAVHFVLQTQLTTPVSLTDSISFPPEWFIGIVWALAHELSQGQPQEIVNRCKVSKEEYLKDLEDQDVEDAQVFFVPDQRSWVRGGSFL